MPPQTVLSLFTGIGGFELAAEMVGGFQVGGFQVVAHCESSSHAQRILKHHWPQIPIISNVEDCTIDTFSRMGIPFPDGVWGGFPCQPHSAAGLQKASQDERDLWPEISRILRTFQPRWAVFENVPGLLSSEAGQFFRGILWDLSSMGFDASWGTLSCADVGGVHQRDRVFVVCWRTDSPDTDCKFKRQSDIKLQARTADALERGISSTLVADADCSRLERKQRQRISGKKGKQGSADCVGNQQSSQSPVSFSDDGLSSNLARLRSHGRYLMRAQHLEQWIPAALIPTYDRRDRVPLGTLAPEALEEYRHLIKEYEALRREHAEQIQRIGNSVSPQVAAIALQHLKTRLQSH